MPAKKIKTKKLSKPKITELNLVYQKVLHWFFSYPTKEISLSDLSTNLKISKKSASIILKQLIEEGFLEKEELGKTWRIKCNLEHHYNFSRKIAYNLQTIYETNILEMIYEKVPNIKSIILFGSYRKGDDNEISDIDIAIEILDDEELKIETLGTFNQLNYRKNVPVNLHIFSRNKIDLNLFNNIANGIILAGFLEVRT